MTAPRTWEDALLAAGKPVKAGRSHYCPQCEKMEHAFAIVEGEDGEWRCSACRTEAAALAARADAEANPRELTWDDIRGQRSVFLAASDWTQLPDVPASTSAAWTTWRQRARDLTDLETPAAAQLALDALRNEAGL